MQLRQDIDRSQNHIRAYGEGYVMINDTRYTDSLVVAPDALITDWPPARFDDLEETHFEMLLALKPEIVLLGTGARQRFPHPRLTRCLPRQGIGLEVMDTAAACRTYDILMTEGRRVAAALLKFEV